MNWPSDIIRVIIQLLSDTQIAMRRLIRLGRFDANVEISIHSNLNRWDWSFNCQIMKSDCYLLIILIRIPSDGEQISSIDHRLLAACHVIFFLWCDPPNWMTFIEFQDQQAKEGKKIMKETKNNSMELQVCRLSWTWYVQFAWIQLCSFNSLNFNTWTWNNQLQKLTQSEKIEPNFTWKIELNWIQVYQFRWVKYEMNQSINIWIKSMIQ